MDPIYWVTGIGAVVVAFILGAATAWFIMRRRQERWFRSRYGSEYDHVVHQIGKKRLAERELIRREERVRQYGIHPLTEERRQHYADAWRRVQAQFVDTPAPAVAEADRLVTEVMQERGYPMGDFEQRAGDLSVDHAGVVTNYRRAHDIADRNDRGQADTEDLRQAMVHYRELFEDLLERPVGENGQGRSQDAIHYQAERI